MDYYALDLPDECIEAGRVAGSFVTRNARFRAAICQHFNLQWVSVGGGGNCFFVSVITALREARILETNSDLNPHQLRLNLVEYFRLCRGSTQPLCERVITDIEGEHSEPLACSSHASINGERLNGLVPGSTERYLDAVANDRVWPQGFHWMRGVSFLYNVRVALIIFGNRIVRFFGEGDATVYLYKFDAQTHFDPLIPFRAGVSAATQASQCTLSQSNAETAPSHVTAAITDSDRPFPEVHSIVIPQCTLPQSVIIISDKSSSSDLEQFTAAAASSNRTLLSTEKIQAIFEKLSSTRSLRPRKPPVQHSSSKTEASDSDTPSHTTAMQHGVGAQHCARRGTARMSTHPIPRRGTISVCFTV